MDNSVDNFEENGFALGEKVLSDDQCQALCDEVEYLVENRESLSEDKKPVSICAMGGMEKPIWQIVDIFMGSEKFRDLVHLPAITEVVAKISGAEELRLWHDQVQYKPTHIGGQNYWHQDWPYWGILDRPSQVTAWIALDEAGEDNGCMSMVKGSHKWGNQIDHIHEYNKNDGTFFELLPNEFEHGKIEHVLCPVPRGHVHYHHGLTWHGSHPNKSGRPRRAIALHYMTEKTCFKEEGGHLMKKYVKVDDGEKICGDAFPLVYADDRAVAFKKGA
jgi:phytanoyl-CoA hydroxylase